MMPETNDVLDTFWAKFIVGVASSLCCRVEFLSVSDYSIISDSRAE